MSTPLQAEREREIDEVVQLAAAKHALVGVR
jgi:hypothetical protein